MLRVFFSFEVILLITGLESYVSTPPDVANTKQSSINALREIIVSETLQTFIPPEFIKMVYYFLLQTYENYQVAQHVIQYLLSVGRTNFHVDEDEILDQASNLCSHQVDFEDVRFLLWAKNLNVDAFVTCKSEEFLKIVNCCRGTHDLTEVPIVSIIDFLSLPQVTEYLGEGESKITVFTRDRQPIKLPVDATPVDFAYQIHTELGNRCKEALVNKLPVPLTIRLKDGDIVEIIKDKNVRPNPEWLSYVVTKTAKNGIRRTLRNIEIQKGRIALEALLEEPISEVRGELQEIIKVLNYKTVNNLLKDLACDRKRLEEVKRLLERIKYEKIYEQVLSSTSDEILLIDKNDKSYKFATCCKPLLDGDNKGVIGKSHHSIRVHRSDCLSLENLHPTRVVSVTCDFVDCRVFLEIKMRDREGAFLSVADALRKNSIGFDIRQIRTYSDQTTAKARIATTIKCKEELNRIVKLVNSMDFVLRTRIVGSMPVKA